MTERVKETVSLCASAFLLTVSAVNVAADAVSERGVGRWQDPRETAMEESDTARTNETRAPNASRATSRWYGQNPFMVVSAPETAPGVRGAPPLASHGRAERAPVAQVPVAQVPVAQVPVEEASGEALRGQDIGSLAARVQWLNQVTLRVMDELDVVHPPPLKKLFAQVNNSGLAGELEGAGKVFRSVASDLQEGFVGLVGTIESISRGEDSGIHLPEHARADKGSPVGADSDAVADAREKRDGV